MSRKLDIEKWKEREAVLRAKVEEISANVNELEDVLVGWQDKRRELTTQLEEVDKATEITDGNIAKLNKTLTTVEDKLETVEDTLMRAYAQHGEAAPKAPKAKAVKASKKAVKTKKLVKKVGRGKK